MTVTRFLAARPRDQLRLSNSEMSTWRRCPRKWWLGTYRELTPRRELEAGTPLVIGNLVHDALAAYYDPVNSADPVAHAQAECDRIAREVPTLADEVEKDRQLVTAMLEGYLEWLADNGADQDLEIEGTERMVEVLIAPPIEVDGQTVRGGVTLLSKLDAPVTRRSDGLKLAFEHKTVGSLDKPLHLLRLDTQLLTEHLARFLFAVSQGATAEEANHQCSGILYNMLRKVKRTAAAKPPFYARVDVPHNVNELRNHWRHVMAVAREIQETRIALDAGADHHTVCRPSPMDDCKWSCPFFKVCPMVDDGSDVEGALAELYVKADPLRRYDDAESL